MNPNIAAAPTTWNAGIKILHWALAVLILAQFGLGWMAASWPLSSLKLNLFVWHKSIGMLILALVVLRLVCRLATRSPPLPPDIPGWERVAAHGSHVLLYVMMVAMPLSGWVISSASGIPFKVFRQFPLPAIVAPDKHTAQLAATVHLVLGLAFAALLVVHVAAALRHHLIKRDQVLIRMLPKRKS